MPPDAPLDAVETTTRHRSGAVARMLGMPVATLRVWERRYAVTQAALSPSGQRLYAAGDVERLALIKQLTDQGHAIGSLASLRLEELQRVAATHADAWATTQPRGGAARTASAPDRPWRLLVVGRTLGRRLARPGLLRRLGQPVELLGPFDDAQQAAAAQLAPVDTVLLHVPQLHATALQAVNASAVLAPAHKAVLYGIGTNAACDALAAGGTALLREPQPDAALALWLGQLSAMASPPAPARTSASASAPPPPRRWDEAALADFAAQSSTVACECPGHVAELLVQLARFEAYSLDCANSSPADAALHAHLQQVAAGCRVQLEGALERVAQHAGLPLPRTAPPG